MRKVIYVGSLPVEVAMEDQVIVIVSSFSPWATLLPSHAILCGLDQMMNTPQEAVGSEIRLRFSCIPGECLNREVLFFTPSHVYPCLVFFESPDLKERFYKGFCKQQLWPLLHYILPVSPMSSGRFDRDLWQSYVKANKTFCDTLVEECCVETDHVSHEV